MRGQVMTGHSWSRPVQAAAGSAAQREEAGGELSSLSLDPISFPPG